MYGAEAIKNATQFEIFYLFTKIEDHNPMYDTASIQHLNRQILYIICERKNYITVFITSFVLLPKRKFKESIGILGSNQTVCSPENSVNKYCESVRVHIETLVSVPACWCFLCVQRSFLTCNVHVCIRSDLCHVAHMHAQATDLSLYQYTWLTVSFGSNSTI